MNQASAGAIGIANARAGMLMRAPATLNALDFHLVGRAIRELCIQRRQRLALSRPSLPTGGHPWSW
jgi:hypothetical protein